MEKILITPAKEAHRDSDCGRMESSSTQSIRVLVSSNYFQQIQNLSTSLDSRFVNRPRTRAKALLHVSEVGRDK